MYSIETLGDQVVYRDGTERLELRIPREDSLGLIRMEEMPALRGGAAAYRDAVRNPQYGRSLRELAAGRGARSACVLVSDATRHVPNSLVSGHIIDELLASGVPLEGILFVVALGVHRGATGEEMREAVGEKYWGKVRIENHRPFDPAYHHRLGTTKYGTVVEVYRPAWECDLHIAIGKVEQHVFAGYSGGRKAVLPGICSERAIMRNHSPENLSHPCARPGRLGDNPVHLDMLEAAKLFRLDYVVNFVVNDNYEVAGVFAGEMEASHQAAVDLLRRHSDVVIPRKPDIIVTTPGHPGNIDLYQGLKPLPALTPLLDGSVTVVLTCEAREGINSQDMMLPYQNTGTPEAMREYMFANYRIQMDSALLLDRALQTGISLIVHSPNIPDGELRSMYCIPCSDPSKLMETAYRVCGKERPRVLFYPMAHKSIPRYADCVDSK